MLSHLCALVSKYNIEIKPTPVDRNMVQINLSKIEQKLLLYC